MPGQMGQGLMQRREAAIAKQEQRQPKNYWSQIICLEYMMVTEWVLCVLKQTGIAHFLMIIKKWLNHHGHL